MIYFCAYSAYGMSDLRYGFFSTSYAFSTIDQLNLSFKTAIGSSTSPYKTVEDYNNHYTQICYLDILSSGNWSTYGDFLSDHPEFFLSLIYL